MPSQQTQNTLYNHYYTLTREGFIKSTDKAFAIQALLFSFFPIML